MTVTGVVGSVEVIVLVLFGLFVELVTGSSVGPSNGVIGVVLAGGGGRRGGGVCRRAGCEGGTDTQSC